MKIPFLDLKSLNQLHQSEIEAAAMRAIRSGWYLNDEEIENFEREWASYTGSLHCVTTANGIDALTATLFAMKKIYGWPEGSEVIVSAHTFIASFQSITRVGLKPVPCEVSSNDYLIDIQHIEALITKQTVAIMPVHLYGRSCNTPAIIDIAHKHGLRVISDACQSHGMSFAGRHATLLCDAAVFSFYPGKNLGAMGDAGALVTNNQDIATIARTFCNYGSNRKYHHEMQGINSRMDSLQAAILGAKLPYLDKQNAIRQQQAEYYNQKINSPLITLPYGGKDHKESVWHIYPVFCTRRDELQKYLSDHGIQTIVHYPIPPHKQKAYPELNNLSLPVTEQICATELSLPLNPVLTREQQDYIIDALNSFSIC